jgi:hypothetical protein
VEVAKLYLGVREMISVTPRTLAERRRAYTAVAAALRERTTPPTAGLGAVRHPRRSHTRAGRARVWRVRTMLACRTRRANRFLSQHALIRARVCVCSWHRASVARAPVPLSYLVYQCNVWYCELFEWLIQAIHKLNALCDASHRFV